MAAGVTHTLAHAGMGVSWCSVHGYNEQNLYQKTPEGLIRGSPYDLTPVEVAAEAVTGREVTG
jgi:hypothetical protein